MRDLPADYSATLKIMQKAGTWVKQVLKPVFIQHTIARRILRLMSLSLGTGDYLTVMRCRVSSWNCASFLTAERA